MIIETLKTLYTKELDRLKTEIESYKNEDNIWHFEKGISNSAGNLCLHLMGNLNTFLGATLAKTDYVRNRELEFSQKNISRSELIKKIEETIPVVERGFNNLSEDQLKEGFPVVIWDGPTETEYTLVFLLSHLSYHLGQINYHRRLLDE